MSRWFDSTRRRFLIRSCQAATLLPASDRAIAAPWLFAFDAPGQSLASEFHLHPHYRNQLPLESLFAKTKAGSDQFVTEKYADEIQAVFSKWISCLKASAPDVNPIGASLAAEFTGEVLRPSASRLVRSGLVQVHRNSFSDGPSISKDVFLQDLHTVFGSLSKIVTAELQV